MLATHRAILPEVHVLIVEDEAPLAEVIMRGLLAADHQVELLMTGEDALRRAKEVAFDVICLDVNLPGINGFETCQRLRAAGVGTPILMLTARDAVEDRIAGLDTGADDYLVKPFDFGELLARLRALGRRPPQAAIERLTVGDLELEPSTLRVRRDGTPIELSAKEVQILEVFMRNPDRVLTRMQILEGAWDSGYEYRSNVIDVYIRYLRTKIDRPFGRRSLETVRGVGYRLRSD